MRRTYTDQSAGIRLLPDRDLGRYLWIIANRPLRSPWCARRAIAGERMWGVLWALLRCPDPFLPTTWLRGDAMRRLVMPYMSGYELLMRRPTDREPAQLV